MSDTDDGFDEEAVREELREKYADDDRGETERMSELLLQGATMTNQHCDRCGNPIFRYEGQSFCPNCQQAAEQQQTAQQQAAQQQADTEGQAAQQPSQPAGGDADAAEGARASQPTGNAAERQQPAEGRQPAERQQSTQPAREQRREQPAPTEQPAVDSELPNTSPSGEAADALESSIAALARRAAGADDPRRAREFLEAAREAAEALDAIRRNA
ncbi:Sjogren's syndrome/scleroderma autoantigen 1 family protein [Halobacterium noricense]|uniref:Sjogren's syndrome/scleroderma autoantigen 1 family protein n=1 Tax=Halobacterium noricense TaxID=223182 RepID=UPI001E5EDF47|nr:Sjogren's syndrome/scleroderma autoantigen 1 family protein [Halobacterium noricense]UHH25341.1 hypothetical protein LT974_15400 [Halobacterium noricense]